MMDPEILLALVHPVLTVVMGGLFVAIWLGFRQFGSFVYFGLTYLCYGAGMTVQVLLWPSDPNLNIALATLLYFSAVIFFYTGLVSYGEGRPRWLLIAGLTLAAIALRLFFTEIVPDRTARIYALNGFVALVFALAMWEVRHMFKRSPLDTMMFLLTGAFVLSAVFRSHWASTTDAQSFGYDGTLYWMLTQVSLNVFLVLFAILLIVAAGTRALDKMRLLGWHDSLTGLHNRMGFREKVARQMRRRRSYSLVLIDLDHFKQVNDRFGHAVGDQLLILFSDHLQRRVRSGDVAARFGGEEFMLFLPDTDESQARDVAERLRRDIAAADMSSLAPGWRFTASFGVAEFPAGQSLNDAYAAVDRLLYQAKYNGRNCVVVASADNALAPIYPTEPVQ